LTTKVLTEFKQKISSFDLEPSSGGCFELTIDGELKYSKLATDEFPDESVLVDEIRQLLG
jgi:selenoprotein W-related protein|tara:strand:+ start:498 stop:677 length:180 start_codon:yes stop_codon:yes gene_type:complete